MRLDGFIKVLFLLLLFFYLFDYNFVCAEDNKLDIYSPSVILMEKNSGKVLYEKNSKQKMFPASTTKIMTAILALEHCNLTDVATVSYSSISSVPSGYSTANLQVGEELTIEQLLYVLLVHSANEAANVIAEHVAGSVDSFSTMMNTKAKELGCENTHFVNPNGVHNDNNYSTAYDLALIGRHAMDNPSFREIVKATSYTLPVTNKYSRADRSFRSTNDLLLKTIDNEENIYFYPYATGIKTGYTKYSKDCIVASALKNDMELICVVLGADETANGLSQRFLDCKTLFNFGFDNYILKNFHDKNDIFKTILIDDASNDTKELGLLLENDVNILMESSNNDQNLLPVITLREGLSAPIKKGECVGYVTYTSMDKEYRINLLAANDVDNTPELFTLLSIIAVVFVLIILFKLINGDSNKGTKYKKNSVHKITRV